MFPRGASGDHDGVDASAWSTFVGLTHCVLDPEQRYGDIAAPKRPPLTELLCDEEPVTALVRPTGVDQRGEDFPRPGLADWAE
jgi:hypothetical protein